MNWIEILGLVGGGAGIVSLIKVGIDVFFAKSNKTTIDIKNMKEMLDASHKMFDEMSRKYDALEKKIDEDRAKLNGYINGLRQRVVTLEDSDRIKEERIQSLERTVTQAYRCKYPENIQDCPVVKAYEHKYCEGCGTCENKEA